MTRGNLVETDAEALVNTVNCVGYMGKGIALQFKKAFPDNFKYYARACKVGEVQPGKLLVFETGAMIHPRYIINFPTKRHWRERARLEDIQSGLATLVEVIKSRNIRSIAIPPLGCGLGGLDWKVVRPMIEKALSPLSSVELLLFEPAGAPEPKKMPVRTQRPRMTASRALFIKLIEQYSAFAYRLTLLEIQKLAYFLQEAGEPLRLKYEAGHYGPYAHNLNKVLEVLEGHYIRGYGDSQKPGDEIELLPEAVNEADSFLKQQPESVGRLQRVRRIIDGFETPYGMELLSTVQWLSSHADVPSRTVEEAIDAVRRWSTRKRRMFLPDHIRVAWEHLMEQGCIRDATARTA